MTGKQPSRRRVETAMDGAIALVAVLLLVQMWVLTASLESYLAGHRGVALPAALVSAAIFTGCWLLYLFLVRLDRESRRG
jgi:predicted Co/Zn/Cd cation transporter (cation efflux family)